MLLSISFINIVIIVLFSFIVGMIAGSRPRSAK
jgi:hypothetical protein